LRLRNVEKGTWKTFLLYNTPVMLMAYARIMKGCHNFIQVVAGYLLGYGVANILYTYEDSIKSTIDKIKTVVGNYFKKN